MKILKHFKYLLYFVALFLFVCDASAQTKKNAKQKGGRSKTLTQRNERDRKNANVKKTIGTDESWKSAWIGQNQKVVLESMGVPTKSSPNGEGGTMITYEKISNFSGGEYTPGHVETATNSYGQTIITGSKLATDTRYKRTSIETTTFYIGKDNLVKKVENQISNRY